MKKIIYIAFIALGLCACDNTEEILNTPESTKSPVAYHFSLQASFDAQTRGVTFDGESTISSQFEGTDKVYVYNETKKALARHLDEGNYVATALQPSSITASGRGCTLEGDLSFWKQNGSTWESVSIDDDDTYSLFYQMNRPNYPDENGGPVYVYAFQKGSAESASQFDFAEANGIVMTKNGSALTVPESVVFTNLQSMFRQHLTFKQGDDVVNPKSITTLSISTNHSTLVWYYWPTDDVDSFFSKESLEIDNPEIIDGDVFLALTFDYAQHPDHEGEQLILTAYDDEGNVYQCAKDVPKNGFENGKYYYGDMTMLWKYKDVRPTVTRTDGGTTITPEQGKYSFNLSSDPDPVEFTISGNSTGYCFYTTSDAIITLDGNGTAVYSGAAPFILGELGLTISLASNYTIDCRNYAYAICADFGYLKLKTTGDSYKLTVIANDPKYRGLLGWDNFNPGYAEDVADLAETGFSVTLTSTTPTDEDNDGNPDYYTWVYTVAPTNP